MNIYALFHVLSRSSFFINKFVTEFVHFCVQLMFSLLKKGGPLQF